MLACVAIIAGRESRAVVFINEVCINPPGSLDDFREYVELQGTPGKKLDGYAIAVLSGTEQKLYPPGSIPPIPIPTPEIDEFFSLDGLEIGPNGLLVIAIAGIDNYPEVLSGTTFLGPWIDLWNGGFDVPGKLQNDGSNTVLLVRNRPGQTEADPNNSGGLRWGKSIRPDFQLIPSVLDHNDNTLKDQWGNGEIDTGQPNGLGGTTLDLKGKTTADILDDLEIVDEVSYESQHGWEYDLDERHVDLGSTSARLPERHVHALDDPQGFNPDALTRVDYRSSGNGWLPVSGGAGEMASGNNWQDTATEQWIRGETVVFFDESGPLIYYDNTDNPDPAAVQPFVTNVPIWLADHVGADYNFQALNTYLLSAGRVNSLAIPFVPGDVDRDGDCDAADIAKIAAVFGNDDWIFSNSYDEAPMGNKGDPAVQTRPWDVDATGDNGVEASDLQWTLNFQGNTNGRIIGRRYDSTTPAASGVTLNSNASVNCTVSFSTNVPSGRPLNRLQTGDTIELTVGAQVTSGANNSPGQNDGVMQFVHDLLISQGSVVRVQSVTPLAPYAMTRASLMSLRGANGDGGIATINGYATDFTRGLSAPAPMYRVNLLAVGLGSASLTLNRAQPAKFALSTPNGLKVGHIDHNGNPNNTTYPSGLNVTVASVGHSPGNCDANLLITLVDYGCLHDCLTGPAGEASPECDVFDFDTDGDIDFIDVAAFMRRFGGI